MIQLMDEKKLEEEEIKKSDEIENEKGDRGSYGGPEI